ncbi:hypothetical protein [uncultured Paraglaciecola sp.]|uniref:hypothetical protein n=1 Tax=uncultured Paraglaciecola sp. TaxID=1765024 RepID=UPI002604E546|nr:hypothetical protein [uncultured Paraglaciecola sp.]
MSEQKPTKSDRNMTPHDDAERYEHPAFGTVSLSRISGGARLFDSEFQHQYFIGLRINTATMDRGLSRNWIYGNDQVAEVWMSESQFATLVSSIGQGSGVPCTLRQIADERMPDIAPMETEHQMHVREFDKHLDEVYTRINDLEKEIQDAKITKKLQGSLLGKIRSVRNAAQSNLKFVANSFAETMETTVERAKMEILGYAQNNGVKAPQLNSQNEHATLIEQQTIKE